MTVQNDTPFISYVGDGIQVTFAFAFQILDSAYLEVAVDDVVQTENVDYTVENITELGGDVVFVVPPADTLVVDIVRNTDPDQQVVYNPYDPFPAKTHEGALDKLTMVVQELHGTVDLFGDPGDLLRRNVAETIEETWTFQQVVKGVPGVDPEDFATLAQVTGGGGTMVPNGDYIITGDWDFASGVGITDPTGLLGFDFVYNAGGYLEIFGDEINAYGIYTRDIGDWGMYTPEVTSEPPIASDTPNAQFSFWGTNDWQLGLFGYVGSSTFEIDNEIEGGNFDMYALNTGGAAYHSVFQGDPDGPATLFHNGIDTLETAAIADGGALVRDRGDVARKVGFRQAVTRFIPGPADTPTQDDEGKVLGIGGVTTITMPSLESYTVMRIRTASSPCTVVEDVGVNMSWQAGDGSNHITGSVTIAEYSVAEIWYRGPNDFDIFGNGITENP